MIRAARSTPHLVAIACLFSISWLGCGGSGGEVPQEVLATRGCHRGNPFDCKVLAAERVAQPYVHDGTSIETEAWCLVFQAGSAPPKASLVYLSPTTGAEKAWIPDFGGKAKFERLGCLEAAKVAPER